MASKKIFTKFEALKMVADHLGAFYHFYNKDREDEDEATHILLSMGSVAASYSDPHTSGVEFVGAKDDWNFVASYMKTFMKLKKLADDGFIQYSEYKDEYGFPIFEVSTRAAIRVENLNREHEKIRKAKMSETLEAKVHEVLEQVFFGRSDE